MDLGGDAGYIWPPESDSDFSFELYSSLAWGRSQEFLLLKASNKQKLSAKKSSLLWD